MGGMNLTKQVALTVLACCSCAANTLNQTGSSLLDSAENIKTLVEAIVSIIGGVCAIHGIRLIKSLREKKTAATFTFWTQLCVKLKMLASRLESEPSLVNNLYSEEVRALWTNAGAPPTQETLTDFINVATGILEFIKNSADQIPAYRGWTDDYFAIVEFLDDISLFDIADDSSRFKFTKGETIEQRDEYVSLKCKTLNRMIEKIQSEQKKIEKRL